MAEKFHRESLMSKAREYGSEKKYAESLRVWKQIMDLNLELSDREREEACDAACSIDLLLPQEEYSMLTEVEIAIYSELAISVIDSLIQSEDSVDEIQRFIDVRWNNDRQLMLTRKGFESWEKMDGFYVKKAREAYARFSLARPKRLQGIFYFLCKLDHNKKMQMGELKKLKDEVEERWNTHWYEKNAESLALHSKVKDKMKETLISEARKYGSEKKYTERLRVWKQILDMNVELSDEERKEAQMAAESIKKLLREEEYTKLSSKDLVTHSELAISVIDRLIKTERNAEMIKSILCARWYNDGELIKKGKGLESEWKMCEFYVEKAREAYARFSLANSHRISWILLHISWLNYNKKMQMEELQKLIDEVEEWWNTHPKEKNEENLEALSKVKDKMKQTKESVISKARKYGSEKNYTGRLVEWKQIVDANLELSDGERKEACNAAGPIPYFSLVHALFLYFPWTIVTYSELAVSVIDRLIQSDKNGEMIGQLLDARSFNDCELIKKGKGLGSWEKRNEFYVKKAREAYAPFSPTHPERIKKIFNWICTLIHNERLMMEELQKLNDEVEERWRTHPNEKNDENLVALSKVKDKIAKLIRKQSASTCILS